MSLKESAAAIQAASKIVVSTHVNPDGDGLGCEAALARALRAMGKQAFVVNQDEAPERNALLRLDELYPSEGEKDYDLAVTVDAPVLERIGSAAETVKAAPKVVKIDHHVSDDTFGDVNWIDSKAAATGEMIEALIAELGVELDADMATGLYTALVHDTGCFRYSNTTAGTLECASRLVAAGARSFEVNTAMYDSRPLAQVKLQGAVMSAMEIFAGGRAVIASVSQEQFKEHGATKEDTEDLVEALRSIQGVEISVFLREDAPGQVKVSLRSKTDANVRLVAEKFNGGGHDKAAGATLHESLDTAREKLAAEVARALA